VIAYAFTIFGGAFLLFQVQPLIGKYILPWFGGSPGVWTTCMLFFQTVLLAGYAYAHYSSSRLKPRAQAITHLALLALALAVLPITPAETWKPHAAGDPTGRILALLAVNLGLPYLVLSATGPLVQHWCSRTHPRAATYRLYALSNAGSLLALVSYPFFFEWALTRSAQARLWAGGLAGFCLVCGYCAIRAARIAGADAARTPAAASPEPARKPARADRLLWLGLPAVASVLLLATTNKLCQDLAVIPFLWVLPLGLYLLTFILCFDSPRWYRRGICSALIPVAIAVVAVLFFGEQDVSLFVQVAGYSGALLVGCLFCHGELYRLRPDPRGLTGYYLVISAGGALGGFLVAVVAPQVFTSYLELPLGYVALTALVAVVGWRARSAALAGGGAVGVLLAILVAPSLGLDPEKKFGRAAAAWAHAVLVFGRAHPWPLAALAAAAVVCCGDPRRIIAREWRPRAGVFLILIFFATGTIFERQLREAREGVVSLSRNFFGVLTVFGYRADDPVQHYYVLEHGQIIHGLQFTEPAKAKWPTTYYGQSSGVGLAIRGLPPGPGRRLGLVGLGTGTLASYGRKGDTLRIYEINPQVEALARSRFTYLARCPAQVDVVLGDARLSMENELARGEPQRFDLLALDAFNSDAIPVHLLTREAFAIYLQHLKPDGVIAVHISNLYFDLEPVVTALARHFGLASVTISDDDESEWWIYGTTWMLVARNPARLQTALIRDAADVPEAADAAPPPLWTDDYTSLFKILR
jgi:hypothetical protein